MLLDVWLCGIAGWQMNCTNEWLMYEKSDAMIERSGEWCSDWWMKRIVGEKLMAKLSLKMTKDRWAPDWYIIRQWEGFFSVSRWGFKWKGGRREGRWLLAASAYWVMEFVADQVKDVGEKLSDLAVDRQAEAHMQADAQTHTNGHRRTIMCCHFLFIFSIYYCMAV